MKTLWPVQQAIYAALTAAPATYAVFDAVPQGSPYPYLVIGEYTAEPDTELAAASIDGVLTLHAFSGAAGKKQAHEMLDFMRARLDGMQLADAWALTEDSYDVIEDEDSTADARVFHAWARYRIRA